MNEDCLTCIYMSLVYDNSDSEISMNCCRSTTDGDCPFTKEEKALDRLMHYYEYHELHPAYNSTNAITQIREDYQLIKERILR